MSLLNPILWVSIAAFVVTTILVGKSIVDYSHPGPQVQRVIRENYLLYATYALLRLAFATFVVCFLLAIPGVTFYIVLSVFHDIQVNGYLATVGGLIAIFVQAVYQFCHYLLFEPGTIASNSHYRMSRLYPLWQTLSPTRLRTIRLVWYTMLLILLTACVFSFLESQIAATPLSIVGMLLLYITVVFVANYRGKARTPTRPASKNDKLNILMIGCDTLRADRLGNAKYPRNLTPNIDKLAEQGSIFTNCTIPLARTAPSLASILTGCWPTKHGIRTNFSLPSALKKETPSIVKTLAEQGYETSVVSDWVGSDMGKFDFGFSTADVPEDQWNLKYLMRQGPKDIRLFLAIFTHNSFAKKLLPEIYFIPGRPLVDDLGDAAISQICEYTESGKPFFLNLFASCSHPPFSVGYPHYLEFADPDYVGESKFSMAKLTDPMEIIRSQSEPREAFDLDQIIDLYDACVMKFDLEVGRITSYLQSNDLLDNTVVVIYSDHGMEFFENGTWGQGNSALGNHSSRIPLVFSHPVGGSTRNGVHNNAVRSIDIAPTLLDLVGIEIPEQMDGISLTGSVDRTLPCYYETGVWIAEPANMPANHLKYPNILELLEIGDKQCGTLSIKSEYSQIILDAKDRVLRKGDWLLLRIAQSDGPRFELYYLESDPHCANNVLSENYSVYEELVAEMHAFLDFGEKD